jgi:hypothetical protein
VEESDKKRRVKKVAPPESDSDTEEDQTLTKRPRMTVPVRDRKAPSSVNAPLKTYKSKEEVPVVNLKKCKRDVVEDNDSDDIDAAFGAEGSD